MSRPLRPSLFAFLTLILAAAQQISASWHPEFDLKPTSNLNVEASEDTLHFTCDGSQIKNRRVIASMPTTIPAIGASATFYIEVIEARGPRVVGFNIFRDCTLRWMKDGAEASWISIVNGKMIKLGPSKISAGSGKHTITYIRGRTSFLLIEDGEIIARQVKPRARVLPSFAVATWETGSKFDIWMTDIQIHNGIRPGLATT